MHVEEFVLGKKVSRTDHLRNDELKTYIVRNMHSVWCYHTPPDSPLDAELCPAKRLHVQFAAFFFSHVSISPSDLHFKCVTYLRNK
jgi:hypothetical protein